MRYLILVLLLTFTLPAYAQHKTVATPVRLQKAILSPAEVEELKNYGDVPLTPQDINQLQTDLLKWNSGKDLRKWQAEYDDIDRQLPDRLEDIIDVLTPQQRAALPIGTKNLYDMKKTKRGEKP